MSFLRTAIAIFAASSFLHAEEGAAAKPLDSADDTAAQVPVVETGAPSGEPEAELDEFVVSAYRFEGGPLDSPVNSTFIDRKKIAASPYSNVAEVLRGYGNINFRSVTGSTASGDLSMRGFGENSQTRILIMVDGQKFNRADMGAINWLQIPLSDVDNIEILRGPQSAIYGSSAEAGVIKITTHKAKEDGLSFEGRASYGSYQTYNLSAHATGRTGDYFFTVTLDDFSSDGWRKNSENDAKSANLSLGWDIDENNTVVVTGNYTDSHISYPGALTLQQYNEDPRQSDGKGAYADSKDGIYTATLTSKSSAGEGEIGLGGNFRDIFWTMGGRSKNFQWTGTFTPRYKFDVGDNAHLLVGFDGAYDDIDFKKYYMQTSYIKSFADVARISLAPYVGGDYSPMEGLTFSAAGRYDAARLRVENTEYLDNTIEPTHTIIIGGRPYVVPNPNYPAKPNLANSYRESMWQDGFSANFGINYAVREDTSVFFKFDRIYHYPTTEEDATYQGAVLQYPDGSPVNYNFNLKAETGQNYEVGVKHITGNWTIVGSAYMMNLNDEIAYYEYKDSSGDTGWFNTNLPPTTRLGIDLELRYDTKYWGASAMFSCVRATFDEGSYDGNEIPLVPNYRGTASVYVRPLEWITLSARATVLSEQYVGSDYTNSVAKIPAYALFDFQADFNFSRYGSVFFAIENAFDKQYISCAWSSGYYPGMGRMLKAGLNIRF